MSFRNKRKSYFSSRTIEDSLKAQREYFSGIVKNTQKNNERKTLVEKTSDSQSSVNLPGYYFDSQTNRYFRATNDNPVTKNLNPISENRLSNRNHHDLQKTSQSVEEKNSLSYVNLLFQQGLCGSASQSRNIVTSLKHKAISHSIKLSTLKYMHNCVNEKNIRDTCYHSVFGLTIASGTGITLIPPNPSQLFNNRTHRSHSEHIDTKVQQYDIETTYSQYFDLRAFLLHQVKQKLTIKAIYWIGATSVPHERDQLAVILTSPIGSDDIRIFSFCRHEDSVQTNHSSNILTIFDNPSAFIENSIIKWRMKPIGQIPIGREIFSIISSNFNHGSSSRSVSSSASETVIYVSTDNFLKCYSLSSYYNRYANMTLSSNKHQQSHIVAVTLTSPLMSMSLTQNNSNNNSNVILAGQRNGDIILIDVRCSHNKQIVSKIARMPSCIDQVASIKNGMCALVLDLTGKMCLFDIRRSSDVRLYDNNVNNVNNNNTYNHSYMSIFDPYNNSTSLSSHQHSNNSTGSSRIRNRKFWLPNSDNPEFVITIAPTFTNTTTTLNSSSSEFHRSSNSTGGLVMYSLIEPNTTLHTLEFPRSSTKYYNYEKVDTSKIQLISSSHRHSCDNFTDFHSSRNYLNMKENKKHSYDIYDKEYYENSFNSLYNNSLEGLYGVMDSNILFQGNFQYTHFN